MLPAVVLRSSPVGDRLSNLLLWVEVGRRWPFVPCGYMVDPLTACGWQRCFMGGRVVHATARCGGKPPARHSQGHEASSPTRSPTWTLLFVGSWRRNQLIRHN